MPVNRKKFMSWINTNFHNYLSTGIKKSSTRESGQPGLFLHQQLVQKFMSEIVLTVVYYYTMV